jgi:nucleoid-associated protein YgaU
MRRALQISFGIAGVMLIVSGCRTATRIVQEPRVDLELSGGNRGYLIGSPPPVSESRKPTREMVETEIEIPSFYKPSRGAAAPVGLGEVAPPEIDFGDETPLEAKLPEVHDAYVVKKGETLWSIAAKPEVFDDATKWRWIYQANRDLLKSPDHIRPGMTLRIPREDAASREPSQGAATFVK